MNESPPDYRSQYSDARWQTMKNAVLRRDGVKCVLCQNDKIMLNVHHLYYITGRFVWDYPLHSLCTLCDKCHEEMHEMPGCFMPWELALEAITPKVRLPMIEEQPF